MKQKATGMWPNPSAVIRHCRGKRKNGCAPATLSMISDVPYAEVVDICGLAGLEKAERGVLLELFQRMLRQLTGAQWQRRFYWRMPMVSAMEFRNETEIWITKRSRWKGCCHVIAVEGEWIYDPGLEGEWPRKHYPLADWRVAMVFQMVGPNSPAKVRVARRIARRDQGAITGSQRRETICRSASLQPACVDFAENVPLRGDR
jgi:hypothetical protein